MHLDALAPTGASRSLVASSPPSLVLVQAVLWMLQGPREGMGRVPSARAPK